MTDREKPIQGLEGYINEFLNDRKREYKTLSLSIESGDLETAKSLAHKWKGICDPYGFGGLGDLSKDLFLELEIGLTEKSKELNDKIAQYLEKKEKNLKG